MSGMQRHRQDNIDFLYIPKKPEGRQEKFAKRSGQLYFAPVLKGVDDFGNNLIVHQRCPGNSELFSGYQTTTAEVVRPLSAGKRNTTAGTKG